MLMLLFYIGDDRYAFECERVIEVIPRVNLKKIPHTPDYVAGMLNFRGLPVPVIDLCQMILDRPCSKRLHTRIIILRFVEGDVTYTLGVLAEKVTQTMQHERKEFVDAGVRIKSMPYVGGALTDNEGVIQFILLDKLLAGVRDVLFFKEK